ncbi:MAG: hypothetical protein IOD12_02955 [Silvanigrellales bacterium]|nr:hypothetical protein [Silvanigrellales bacterium]
MMAALGVGITVVLSLWGMFAFRSRQKFFYIVLFLPLAWILLLGHTRVLGPWLKRRKERSLFLAELRMLIDHLSAATSVGLHLHQSFPRDAETYLSLTLRNTFAALERSRILGEDTNALMEKEGRLLLLGKGEERYAGLLFASLAVSERMGANTSKLLQALRVRLDARHALLRKVRIDTAQARFQGVVLCLAPFLLGGGYAFIFPRRFAFFLDTPIGNGLLAVILALTLLGGAVTWRLVSRWTETIA